MKLHLINGPNLNLLGKREPSIYGSQDFETYFQTLKTKYPQTSLTYFQSNSEGKLIDYLHEIGFSSDGIVFNGGAYTHTSIALGDAIRAIHTPVIEVHLSNVYAREDFRKVNYIAPACLGSICGLGIHAYELAVLHHLSLK
ncbi:MAG: 3-dehydroquinate dehydratase [Cyclobacteriaceae bacterium]|nr:3-dehydroquinate dehydratase [Cyclobacteriaceae bacterium]MCH8516623.1 3-dehydroquinate dehydratase [Cyclobacteriaceae bacterium]